MTNLKFSLTILLAFFQSVLYSQEVKIKVLDSENLAPIAYAHILFDHKEGAITNSDGVFVVNLKTSKNIVISHISYESKEITMTFINSSKPILLDSKSNDLEEVVMYSMDNIFKNISKGLKTNYDSGALDELMFFRLSLMKNKTEGQLSEGYIQVQRAKYFDRSKDKKNTIQLISNRKINTLKNVDFQYYSYQKIIELSESFINLNNEYYTFDYNKIDDDLLKIEFKPTEGIEPKEVVYTGYLLINIDDYSLVEFQYSIAEVFKKHLSKKEIGKHLLKKDVNASKLVKWIKDSETETYRLSFLRIKDELAIEDSKTNTVDHYIATYELYNVGSTEDYLKIDAKKRKTNSKKNVFEYSNFNVSDTTLDHIRPILRNKEQNSNLMILKNRPTTP